MVCIKIIDISVTFKQYVAVLYIKRLITFQWNNLSKQNLFKMCTWQHVHICFRSRCIHSRMFSLDYIHFEFKCMKYIFFKCFLCLSAILKPKKLCLKHFNLCIKVKIVLVLIQLYYIRKDWRIRGWFRLTEIHHI